MASTWILVVGLHCVLFASGQKPVMEILRELADPPGIGMGIPMTVTPNAVAWPSIQSFISQYKKICVQGLWGMYSEPGFGQTGQGIPKGTMTPIFGMSRGDCTNTSVQTLLANTKSIRPLGFGITTPVPEPVPDLGTRSFEYYSRTFFFWDTALTDPTLVSLQETATETELCGNGIECNLVRSFVINGYDGYYRLCNSTGGSVAPPNNPPYNECICLAVPLRGRFMVPEALKYPPNAPLGTITSIMYFLDNVDTGMPPNGCISFAMPNGLQ